MAEGFFPEPQPRVDRNERVASGSTGKPYFQELGNTNRALRVSRGPPPPPIWKSCVPGGQPIRPPARPSEEIPPGRGCLKICNIFHRASKGFSPGEHRSRRFLRTSLRPRGWGAFSVLPSARGADNIIKTLAPDARSARQNLKRNPPRGWPSIGFARICASRAPPARLRVSERSWRGARKWEFLKSVSQIRRYLFRPAADALQIGFAVPVGRSPIGF